MTLSKPTQLQRDAHNWMKDLRFDYYQVAAMRRLRLGDRLWVAHFSGPGVAGGVEGCCDAYFERVRGGYSFFAVWTINFSRMRPRPHVITSGKFKLLAGNVIEFASDQDVRAVKSFRTVCRYSEFVARHLRDYGMEPWLPAPYYCHSMFRGTTVFQNGLTKYGCEGPQPRGISPIVEAAMALGVIQEGDQVEQ